MDANKLDAGVTLLWTLTSHPGGGIEILLVASCYRNWDKLQPYGLLGSYADLTYTGQ